MRRLVPPLLLAIVLASPVIAATRPAAPHAAPTRVHVADATPFWTGITTPESFAAREHDRIARAKASIAAMLAVKGPRTVDNTLERWNEAQITLDAAGAEAGVIQQAHPDSAMRAVAEKASQEVSAYATRLSLDRAVYEALAAIDTSHADQETRFYLWRLGRDFRMSGVDRDSTTRARIQQLNDELTVIGQQFAKNIRDDLRTVKAKPDELQGLPADFIARHKPDAAGLVTLDINYPDYIPVMTYANSGDLRHRLMMEYSNRGWPNNMAVLDSMISKRWQLARLVGFGTWADYALATRMAGTPQVASTFIDTIVAVSGPRATQEYQVLLARRKKDAPEATRVEPWESAYYSEQVRKTDYDFDAQTMRPYFPFKQVEQGVLDVVGRMFDITFKRVNVPVWDPSVETYEVLDHGALLGRVYLDMHPRPNKYNHAANFRLHTGVAGRQIVEGALLCNLPGGDPNDPGLCEQDDVETFFHEFGHLMHSVFAGRHRWVGVSGIRTERDFVEAPSQMLEEWMRDPQVLATFAKQYQTGEAIPAALVHRMVRASRFGEGLQTRRQMVYARMSLSYYDRDPKQVDTDAIAADIESRYTFYPHVPGTHGQCNFGHLDGYSAAYYTYMWSLVIAKDMFSKFDKANLLDPTVANRYRRAVLEPGGSAPAATLVADFLGRPFSFEAYRRWLNESDKEQTAGSDR